jgi:hypothetical protein
MSRNSSPGIPVVLGLTMLNAGGNADASAIHMLKITSPSMAIALLDLGVFLPLAEGKRISLFMLV